MSTAISTYLLAGSDLAGEAEVDELELGVLGLGRYGEI